jgi:hypothetical protein
VQRVLSHSICAILGVHKTLWLGSRDGSIHVLDVYAPSPFRVLKRWNSGEPVLHLNIDASRLAQNELVVLASGPEGIRAYDGLLHVDWIERNLCKPSMQARYSTQRELQVFAVTYNVDAAAPSAFETPSSVGWLHDMLVAAGKPDVIVFGESRLSYDSRHAAAHLCCQASKS